MAAPRGAPRRGPRCCRDPRRCSGSPGRDARRRSSRRSLPVRPDEPPRAHDLPQTEHRGVRGEDDELAAGRCELEPAIECALERGDDLDRLSSRPPYLKRKASSAARSPVATSRSRPSSRGSKSTSQIQETSRAVGDRVVQRDHGHRRCAAVDDRPHGLVGPGGVLDQEHQQPRSPTVMRSKRPNAAVKRLEPRDDLL